MAVTRFTSLAAGLNAATSDMVVFDLVLGVSGSGSDTGSGTGSCSNGSSSSDSGSGTETDGIVARDKTSGERGGEGGGGEGLSSTLAFFSLFMCFSARG